MATDVVEAARRLKAEDLSWLAGNHPELGEAAQPERVPDIENEDESGEEAPTEDKPARRNIEHAWPQVGTELSAEYHGTTYLAEVVTAPQYKSGKAIKILTGPAAGKIKSSMSGAMMLATERQREEEGLGRSGMSNGWDFWEIWVEDGYAGQ